MGSSKKKNFTKTELKAQKRKELFRELIPLGKSFGLWIVLVVIVAADYTNHKWFSMIFVDYTTYLTYALAKLFFLQASILDSGVSVVTTLEVEYNTITVSNFPMLIELECSAYHAYLAMFALVLFSAWNYKQKLVVGAIIFGLLSFINSLRIVLLGVIGKSFPQIFNVMHDYIWNILLVIVIWGLWELANRKLNSTQK